MKAKTLIVLTLLAILLLSTFACGGGGDEEEEGVTELKYGVGLPLTGQYGAAVGIPEKYAFNLVNEKIGEFTVAGKQYRWKVIFEDNLGTAGGGTSSATKLIYEHNVDFMLQTLKDPGMVAAPMCEELGMLCATSGAEIEDFGPNRPHLFQTSATFSLHAPIFFDWLTKEHPEVKRVAVSGPDDMTGRSIGEAIATAAEHFGLEIVSKEYAPLGLAEYMPIATKIASTNPDLFIGAFAGALESIYELMVALGYEGLGASYYWTEAGAERIGWDICEGYIIFMPIPLGDIWPEAAAFRDEYEDSYGLELAPSAFWAANVLFVLTDALKQAGTVDDIDKIIQTMETEKFDTLIGPIGYGLEELNGIGHLAIYPTPIIQVVGKNEYELLHMYSPEETEAVAVEVLK